MPRNKQANWRKSQARKNLKKLIESGAVKIKQTPKGWTVENLPTIYDTFAEFQEWDYNNWTSNARNLATSIQREKELMNQAPDNIIDQIAELALQEANMDDDQKVRFGAMKNPATERMPKCKWSRLVLFYVAKGFAVALLLVIRRETLLIPPPVDSHLLFSQ